MPRWPAVLWLTAFVSLLMLAGCSTSGPASGVARGKVVYETCAPCHGANGGGSAMYGAPAIAGLPEWYVQEQLKKFKGGMRGTMPDDMEGSRMRPMTKTLKRPEDIPSVAAYVASLPHVRQPSTLPGSAESGAARYNSICVACHGADGTGNQALMAPRIAGQADWYMYRQLQKFKGGMRGMHPDDTAGAQMAAMSQTLEDSTAMLDVIAYIRTLDK